MNEFDVRDDIRMLFKRIDGIKDTQLEMQKEILDLSKRLTDNLQRDFESNKELKTKIESMAGKAGRGAGIKWASIISAVGTIIIAIASQL